MRIANVLHFYNHRESARELIEFYYSVHQLNRTILKKGARVEMFQRFHRDEFHSVDGINYHFIADGGKEQSRKWHSRSQFNKKVREIIGGSGADIIQAHNPFTAMLHDTLLRQMHPIPYVIQDHSGLNSLKHKQYLKHYLKNVDGIMFSARGMEKPWLEANIFEREQCHYVMEASCEWRMDESKLIRSKQTPALLWVGNLDENKNPLCVLHALAQFKKLQNTFRLTMIYRGGSLESKVEAFIYDHDLQENGLLVGEVERDTLPDYFHSHDYFVGASYKEGSGYSLIEAMSCGLIPILTEIPAYLELTKNEDIGYHFPVNNDLTLLHILSELKPGPVSLDAKKEIVDFFEKHFSYDALADQTLKIYREIING